MCSKQSEKQMEAAKTSTYPKEANYNSKREKEEISHQKSTHPNNCQSPTDEFITSIGAG